MIRVDANTLYRTSFDSTQPKVRPETPDLIVPELDRPSVLDVAEASFRRETILGRLFAVHGVADGTSPEPGWNPYSYFARSREDYEDLANYVAQGAFDAAHSERQFKQVRYRNGSRLDRRRANLYLERARIRAKSAQAMAADLYPRDRAAQVAWLKRRSARANTQAPTS